MSQLIQAETLINVVEKWEDTDNKTKVLKHMQSEETNKLTGSFVQEKVSRNLNRQRLKLETNSINAQFILIKSRCWPRLILPQLSG